VKQNKQARELHGMLKDAGAVLERQRKHQVWRLPSGRIFVCSNSPGDHRWSENAIAVLRKVLAGTEATR
jgi:hypothetical protein